MNVKLISYTPEALDLLLRTKNTRLKFDSDPAAWTPEQKSEHLAYMRDTIKSSWGFVDYVFEISGVTRAFTHQLVRTGVGTVYAQESQRTVDVREGGWVTPESGERHGPAGEYNPAVPRDVSRKRLFNDACDAAFQSYAELVDSGMPVQDARGVLPTAAKTSIIGKFSLRTLHDMGMVRLCTRTQGEYQDVFRAMRSAVIKVHPWVDEHRFIEVHCVSEGTCAFPRFGKKECKFYAPWMDRDAEKAQLREVFWSSSKQVAVPIARGGKTM